MRFVETKTPERSYVARVLRLTLLAPDIIEAILDGRQPPDMTLGELLRPFPVVGRNKGARRADLPGPDYSSKPVDSALNLSCLALSRTTLTSLSAKPSGASAAISSVSFSFAPWVR